MIDLNIAQPLAGAERLQITDQWREQDHAFIGADLSDCIGRMETTGRNTGNRKLDQRSRLARGNSFDVMGKTVCTDWHSALGISIARPAPRSTQTGAI